MKGMRAPAITLAAALVLEWLLARVLANRDVIASIVNGGNLAWLAPLGVLLTLRLLSTFVLPPWLLWRIVASVAARRSGQRR
jgi:hypothetical protein